jgi:hypothetical protein
MAEAKDLKHICELSTPARPLCCAAQWEFPAGGQTSVAFMVAAADANWGAGAE